MYYKVGQTLLQSGACTTRWGKFYYKLRQASQIGVTFITKLGNYYGVGQYKGQRDLKLELHNMIKWSSEGTDLFRKINVVVRAHNRIDSYSH